MKAESYFTLLDGLLATAVYHPHKYKPGAPLRTLFFWSVSLCGATVSPDSPGSTVTRMPESLSRVGAAAEEMGMKTSTTPVCKYCIPL